MAMADAEVSISGYESQPAGHANAMKPIVNKGQRVVCSSVEKGLL